MISDLVQKQKNSGAFLVNDIVTLSDLKISMLGQPCCLKVDIDRQLSSRRLDHLGMAFYRAMHQRCMLTVSVAWNRQ